SAPTSTHLPYTTLFRSSYLFTDGSSQLAPASEAAVGYDNTSVYYIPADRTGDWIVDGRDPGHITETYGPGGEDLAKQVATYDIRSEEHTSELQSRENLV